MTLFSDPTCPYCHRVRMVIAEKRINIDIVDVDAQALPAELFELNPYGTVPTLVDRDLVLYDGSVINDNVPRYRQLTAKHLNSKDFCRF